MIIEAISIHGDDFRYIPRKLGNFDQLLGSDDSSIFDNAYTVEMQVVNTYGFTGDKDFYSKFGHQVRDELILAVSRTRWQIEVGDPAGQSVPDEGDIIWSHRYQKAFVVKYVDPREMFYQLGRLYTWELTCEVFELSGEQIATGDPEIDAIEERSTSAVDWALTTENGVVLTTETGDILVVDAFQLEEVDPGYQNDYDEDELQRVANVNITIIDPFDFLQSQ